MINSNNAISPFRAERKMAKSIIGDNKFIEVFIDVPLSVAETRDPKGLYKKARRGEIKNFTGISSPYQKPNNPDVKINSNRLSIRESSKVILDYLFNKIKDSKKE